MANMGRYNYHQFFHDVENKTGVPAETVSLVWEGVNEIMIEELLRYGEMVLPYTGKIRLEKKGGYIGKVPVKNNPGQAKVMFIEPFYKIRFVSSEIFKQNINNNRPPQFTLNRKRERYRKEVEKERSDQELRDIALKKRELMEKARKVREERLAEQKKRAKMKKKDRIILEKEESQNENSFDYGTLEE